MMAVLEVEHFQACFYGFMSKIIVCTKFYGHKVFNSHFIAFKCY